MWSKPHKSTTPAPPGSIGIGYLVLQLYGMVEKTNSALHVIMHGDGLVPATPSGPGHDPIVGRHECQPEARDQTTDLGDAQRHKSPRLALNAAIVGVVWRLGPPFAAARSAASLAAFVTARYAWASKARLMWRCQPSQLRTS